jgi:DNA-binding transcriptional LysR family regulator
VRIEVFPVRIEQRVTSEWIFAPSLADGSLVRVLPQWSQRANLYAVSSARSAQSAKVRLCVEALREQMAARGNVHRAGKKGQSR